MQPCNPKKRKQIPKAKKNQRIKKYCYIGWAISQRLV